MSSVEPSKKDENAAKHIGGDELIPSRRSVKNGDPPKDLSSLSSYLRACAERLATFHIC
jgi:hypothetical protein